MGKAEQYFEERTEVGLESPHSEASKMLEAALQQMDGIISGGRWETHCSSGSSIWLIYSLCVCVCMRSCMHVPALMPASVLHCFGSAFSMVTVVFHFILFKYLVCHV
jgi:hypothetical protein